MGLLIIPEPYKVGFKRVALLEDSSIQELLSAFRNTSPSLYAKEITEQVIPQVKSISASDVINITETLFSLYVSHAGQGSSLTDFVEGVIQAIDESDYKELVNSTKTRDTLTQRLSALLNVDPMIVGAKSYILLFDNDRNFRSARVVTDIRPVFTDEAGKNPSAVMIVHQLKITYLEGDVSKDFYIAMDNKDIQRFMDALTRADLKAQTLKPVFEELKVLYIEPE